MNQFNTDSTCVHSVALALQLSLHHSTHVAARPWTGRGSLCWRFRSHWHVTCCFAPLCPWWSPLPWDWAAEPSCPPGVPQPAEELPGHIPFSGQSSQPLVLMGKHNQTRLPLVLCFRTPELFLFPDRLGWSEPPTCSQHGIIFLALPS